LKCTFEQFENELRVILFPYHPASYLGAVIHGVPKFCECKGGLGVIDTPAKGVVREFSRCVEFDYAVFCPACKTTRSFISRYYPDDKSWKMKYQDQCWINVIDVSEKPWYEKIEAKIFFMKVVVKQAVIAIKSFSGNKVVYGAVLIFKLFRDVFQRNKR